MTKQDSASASAAQPAVNLKPAFSAMVKEHSQRTNFNRERIEFYLPPELKGVFKSASVLGGRLNNDDVGQRLFEFVEKDIFGVLPNFRSAAKIEQADGIFIHGKLVSGLMMPRDVAFKQVTILRKAIDQESFIKLLVGELHEKYASRPIRDVVFGSGALALLKDRWLQIFWLPVILF